MIQVILPTFNYHEASDIHAACAILAEIKAGSTEREPAYQNRDLRRDMFHRGKHIAPSVSLLLGKLSNEISLWQL
jgi:hypothetical protein